MFLILIPLLLLVNQSFALAILPSDSSARSRIAKKQLSNEEHFQDLDHDGNAEIHNRDFDHEAFLGDKDAADEFDELTPEESKARLTKIITKIDTNGDGNLTESELKNWILQSQHKYINENVERQWQSHIETLTSRSGDKTPPSVLTWENFRNTTYGFLTEIAEPKKDKGDLKTYAEMLKLDERRWRQADIDGDGALSKKEFFLFSHPEEYPRMHAVVVAETIEDMDLDGDGRISEAEYISEMYSPEEEHSSYVPEWVQREREQFRSHRDKDSDGYLSHEEVRDWIVPADYDHAEAEAKHLMHEADKNQDNVLTKEEILENYDVFVGSQVTNFGEALIRHDEF